MFLPCLCWEQTSGEEDSEDDEDAETEAGQPGDFMETLGLPVYTASLSQGTDS